MQIYIHFSHFYYLLLLSMQQNLSWHELQQVCLKPVDPCYPSVICEPEFHMIMVVKID